jgi:multiple sugar transport system ATP-binding protein
LSNLDAKLRVQMRSELKRFHQDLNATVIYVTHDQLEAVTMADKMAVMSGGVLQQYDAPAEVFAHPRNMFVASFVGSPAMSLIALDAATTNGQTVLRSPEGWSLTLSPESARKAQHSSTSKVVLGARHSTIRLHKAATANAVPGKVYIVEPTGDVTFAQVYVGEHLVTVSLDAAFAIQPDEMVWVEFDQSKIHLFDGVTQQALTLA